jgi:hypothetical protein
MNFLRNTFTLFLRLQMNPIKIIMIGNVSVNQISREDSIIIYFIIFWSKMRKRKVLQTIDTVVTSLVVVFLLACSASH